MTSARRGAARTIGEILAIVGCGMLLGHGVAFAALGVLVVPVLWIATGMVALGVPLLVWGSRGAGGGG